MIPIADPVARRVPFHSVPLHGVPLLARKQCPPACSLAGHPSRRAFTLTELLVVITIIGMLASISLGALYSARETARVQKTKATIAKLDRIVQARYEEFASRRMPFSENILSSPSGLPLPRNLRPRFLAEARLRAVRKLQQWEMPEKLEDLADPMTTGNPAFVITDIDVPWTFQATFPVNGVDETWTVQMKRTAIARTMFRRCALQITTPPSPSTVEDNAGTAEVLYLWIATGDREAVEQFQASEIGDTDADGYPEFIDAWGGPIRFIRWPSSFVGESELMTGIDDDNDPSTIQIGDPENDHDPFDSRRIDPAAFRLVPLVYSIGPDKQSGLEIEMGATRYVDIYDVNKSFGKPDGTDAHLDNIHNHSLGMN